MTVRAILGLLALNGAYAVLGITLLWAIRGLPRWTDVLRLAGLGYLLGVAAFGVVWTQLLVLGVPLSGWGLVLSLVCGTVAAGGCGRPPRPPAAARLRRPGRHAPTAAVLVTAAGVALTGLLLEALFRSARLQSLQAYDAWAFWVPKAKAIYFFGGLDQQVFTTFPGPTYPPLVPILDAAAFHAMGSADVSRSICSTGSSSSARSQRSPGCLYRHVPAWLLWPSLVLVLAVPRVASGLLAPQADVLVDVLFVVGALLLALWLRDGRGWRLAAAAVLFAGAGPDEARGPPLRRGRARGRARGASSVATSRVATPPRGRGGRRRGGAAVAALVPEQRHRRGGARPTSARAARSTGCATRCGSRSTSSSTRPLWSVVPDRSR